MINSADGEQYDDAHPTRAAGGLVIGAAVLLAAVLLMKGTCQGSPWNPGLFGFLSLFSWAHWILLGLLLAAGVTMLAATTPATAGVAAAVGLVPAAQLSAAGVVAFRHWHPAAGMSGCGRWNNMQLLEAVALVGAAVAAVAALACLWVLRRCAWRIAGEAGSTTAAAARRTSILIGLVVAVALPHALAVGDGDAQDIESYGAFALLWSLPWGGALVLSAWLKRPAAVAVGLTVAVASVSAYPRYELVLLDRHWLAALTGLVAGALVAGLRAASPSRTRSPGGLTANSLDRPP